MRASTANSGNGGSSNVSGGLGPVHARGGRSGRSVVSTSGDSSATANSNQQRLWALQQQQQAQAHPRYGFAATAAPLPTVSVSGDHAHLYSAWRATPTPPPPPPAQPLGYGLAGYGYTDAAAHHSQPSQPLQPRPPTQSSHAQLSLSQSQHLPAHGPPQSARGRAGGSRVQPPRPHTHDDSSPSRSLTAAPATAAAGGSVSLHEKVAAALQELESIKSNSFRPSTAGPFVGGGGGGGGGGSAGGGWGDGALPRPNLSAAPSAAAAAAAAASASGAARAASLAESRTAAELRTAKSIVKKLYKRNVKLMQELNLMVRRHCATRSVRWRRREILLILRWSWHSRFLFLFCCLFDCFRCILSLLS